MARWRVWINWAWEGEAENESEALMNADTAFDLVSEAQTEEVEPVEPEAV